MRFAIAVFIACCVASTSLGQSRLLKKFSPAQVAADEKARIIAYKLTWRDQSITFAKSCSQADIYYLVESLSGAWSKHPIASIVLIEPLNAQQLSDEQALLGAAKEAEAKAKSLAAVATTVPRKKVRTAARTDSRTTARQADSSWFDSFFESPRSTSLNSQLSNNQLVNGSSSRRSRPRRNASMQEYDQFLQSMSQMGSSASVGGFGGAGLCGAVTKTTNAPCRNLVSGGGYCHMHR